MPGRKKREWERHNEIYTDQSHGRVGSQLCQYIWSMSTVDISTRFEKARVDSYRNLPVPESEARYARTHPAQHTCTGGDHAQSALLSMPPARY